MRRPAQRSLRIGRGKKRRGDTAIYLPMLRRVQKFDAACRRARTFTLREQAQKTIEFAECFGVEWRWK